MLPWAPVIMTVVHWILTQARAGLGYNLSSCEWVSQICFNFKDQYTLWVHHRPSNYNTSRPARHHLVLYHYPWAIRSRIWTIPWINPILHTLDNRASLSCPHYKELEAGYLGVSIWCWCFLSFDKDVTEYCSLQNRQTVLQDVSISGSGAVMSQERSSNN